MTRKKLRHTMLCTLLIAEGVPLGFAQDLGSQICHVSAPQKAGSTCKNGDILLFTPETNVTPRNVVALSSLVCDFRYEVVLIDTSLSCIFTNKRRSQWEDFGIEMTDK